MMLIVVPPKRIDLVLRVLHRREPVHVQAFVSEPAIERFDGGVVRGPTGTPPFASCKTAVICSTESASSSRQPPGPTGRIMPPSSRSRCSETPGAAHAHGVMSTKVPARSAIVLRPSETEEGLLQAREILNLRWNASLVTLSACNTSTGGMGCPRPANIGGTSIQCEAAAQLAGWQNDERRDKTYVRQFVRFRSGQRFS